MKFVDPGCRWCSDDDGDQVGDVGSPFLRLRKHSLWRKKKLKDMHISDKENIFYNYDFINDNDEKTEIKMWAGLPVAWWRCGCRLLVYGFVCGCGRTVVRLLFGCGLALRIGSLVAASRLPGGNARAVGLFLDGCVIRHWMLLRLLFDYRLVPV